MCFFNSILSVAPVFFVFVLSVFVLSVALGKLVFRNSKFAKHPICRLYAQFSRL